MPDLLRLPSLTHVRDYEENGAIIVVCRGPGRKPNMCNLFCRWTLNGRKDIRYRDHAIQGQPTWIEIEQQRFKCGECKKTAYEKCPDLDGDRRVTKRFGKALALTSVDHTFMAAAKIHAVDYSLTRRVFKEYAAQKLDRYVPKMPRVLGIDEKNVRGQMRLVIGDIEGSAMLDMRPSRTEDKIRPYFEAFPDRGDIRVVCMDMWRTYRKVSLDLFPRCVVVIDKWHALRMSDWGVEKVRRLLQGEMSRDERVRLKRKNRLLMCRFNGPKTNDGQRGALKALFETHPALGTAYRLREAFYDLYELGTRAEAEQRMTAWLAEVKAAPHGMDRIFTQLVTAIGNWRPYMLNYFDHPFTNAYVESLNNCIGKINASAAGLDYDLIRAKAMLRYSHLREEPVYKLRKKREEDLGGPMTTRFMTGLSDYERVRIGSRLVHSGVPLSTLEAVFDEEAADTPIILE